MSETNEIERRTKEKETSDSIAPTPGSISLSQVTKENWFQNIMS